MLLNEHMLLLFIKQREKEIMRDIEIDRLAKENSLSTTDMNTLSSQKFRTTWLSNRRTRPVQNSISAWVRRYLRIGFGKKRNPLTKS